MNESLILKERQDTHFNRDKLIAIFLACVLILFSSVDIPATEFDVMATPPGAIAGGEYNGTIETNPPLNFLTADSIKAIAFFPQDIRNLQIVEKTSHYFSLRCTVDDSASGSRRIDFYVYRDSIPTHLEFFLNVVEKNWSLDWRPIAVAPNDTVVNNDTCMVILNSTRSTHGGGYDMMHFKWIIDDADVIKGEPITSTTLPKGNHTIILEAEDKFGNTSVDSMSVEVLHDHN